MGVLARNMGCTHFPLRVLHISLKEPKMFLQQWMSEGTRTNEACPQIWICHVTHVDGSRHSHKCVTWTWSSCVPFHIWRSLFTYTRHFSHLHNVPSAWRTDVRDMTHSYVDKSRHTRERVSSKKKKKESRQKRKRKSLVTHIWMGHVTHMSGWRRVWLFHICLTRLFHICVTRLFEWVTSGIQRVSSHKCERVPLFANRY